MPALLSSRCFVTVVIGLHFLHPLVTLRGLPRVMTIAESDVGFSSIKFSGRVPGIY